MCAEANVKESQRTHKQEPSPVQYCTRLYVSASYSATCPLLIAVASNRPFGLYLALANSPLLTILAFSSPKVSTALLSTLTVPPTPDVANTSVCGSGCTLMLQACPGCFNVSEGDQEASAAPREAELSDMRLIVQPMLLVKANDGEDTFCSASTSTIASER